MLRVFERSGLPVSIDRADAGVREVVLRFEPEG
jgi:hypothetical protein